jgi:hypothetical protein
VDAFLPLTLANWRENLPDPAVKRQSIVGSFVKREAAMVAKSAPRIESKGSKYYYRRSSLNAGDTLRALGIGVAAGLAAFYLARIALQRTPLIASDDAPRGPRRLRAPTSGGA